MQKVWLAAIAVTLGCAGSSSGPIVASSPRDATTSVVTEVGTVDLRTTRSDPTGSFTIAAPTDRVWRALSLVYTDLKLTATTLDTQSRRIGVENARLRRQIGGTRMSKYISCGDRLGNPVADTDDILLTLYTQVVPAATADSSTLRTLVEATARQSGSGGAPINCATTGELEKRIVSMVRAQTAS
jgi:hypothetical protein